MLNSSWEILKIKNSKLKVFRPLFFEVDITALLKI